MAKFILHWQLDPARVPVDPKERAAGWGILMQAVHADIKKGVTTEWGAFAGEGRGYCVVEGSAADVHTFTQQYAPFVHFETKALVSTDEVDALLKKMKNG